MRYQGIPLSSITLLALCCLWGQTANGQGSKPVITEQPSDAIVLKNSPTELKCKASGSPKPKISWLKDGVVVSNEKSGRRTVLPDGSLYFLRTVSSKRKRTDSGTYQCLATNRNGIEYSRKAKLLIGTLKNVFRSEPENQTVYPGESVVMKCTLPRGFPVPSVSWLHDGNLVTNTSKTLISVKGNLTISSVTEADEGSYVCRSKSPLGTQDSRGALLTVEKPGTPLTVKPISQSVVAGKNTTFQCYYRDGPQDEVTWQKEDGSLLSVRHVVDKGVLTITNVTAEDKGTYVCSVNSGLQDLTLQVTLEVKTKPRIVQQPADVIVNEGSSAKFVCNATGEPQPTVFWEKDGKAPMFPNAYYYERRFFVTRYGHSLEISRVEKGDEGVYTCWALTPDGNTHADAKLTVIGPTDVLPSIITGPLNQSVDEGTDVDFSCEVDGNPEPSVSWFLNDDILALQNTSNILITRTGLTSQLSITNVSESDRGVYKCVAISNIGTASEEADLQVNKVIITTTPPPPTTVPTPKPSLAPLDLVVTSVTHNSVDLAWSSVTPPGVLDVMYVVEFRKSDSNQQWVTAVSSFKENKLTVSNLESNTKYMFNVKAVGPNGSMLTQPLKPVPKRTKKMPVVSIKPSPSVNYLPSVKIDVDVTPAGSNKINITWSLSEPIEITSVIIYWRKKDSDVFYIKPRTSFGSSYSLNGLEANTSYEIQVQVVSGQHKGPKSTSAFATTHEKKQVIGIVSGGGVPPTTGLGGSNGDVSVVEARGGSGDTWHKMKMFIRQPWFIGTMGAVAWLILLVVVLVLYRQRRHKKKLKNALATKVCLPTDNIPRSQGTRASKFLWMEERNSDPTQQLTNNRSSDSSTSDCTRQMGNCCRVRGGSSNNSLDFPNKITLNQLSGSGNPLDTNHYSPMDVQHGKSNNIPNSNYHYHEHVNKSNKFLDSPSNRLATPSGSRSPSESTLPKNGPKERIRYLDYPESGTNRSKSSTGSRRRDPNQTPSDSSDTEKTKPKLKIQSFEMAGNIHTTSTFHSEPPPPYEAVLKETEMEMQKFPLHTPERLDEVDRKEEEEQDTSAKPDSSEARKSPALERPSSPGSERSCKTSTSCGSLQRKRKALKPPPRLAIFNWADLLPPPPSEPPPSSLGSPPPSPPFSERSAMTGMTGRTGMSGMSAMSGMTGMSGTTGMSGQTGMSGMTGLTGRTGMSEMSGVTGKSGLTEPRSHSARRAHRKAGPTPQDGENDQESVTGKSEKSKKSRSKPKPIPIDLEGITSDIIMQWAESVTNTSGSEDDSSCSSPSRISGISSDGSFFTDADFANAVRVAAECGGFNTDAYGLMDSLGIPPPYTAGWKRSNSFSNDNEASLGTAAAYGPRPLRKRWETGSEGDLEYTPPNRVRPRLRRDNEKGPNEKGPNDHTGPVRIQRMAQGELIRQMPGMRTPVPIVPSQPRRPLHRVARPGGPPLQTNPAMLVQPLKKTTTLGVVDPREPLKKKYAIVKKIPQSQDNEKVGGYQSCSMSSSKSSTSTASTVKSSSCAPTVHDDSDLEGSVA